MMRITVILRGSRFGQDRLGLLRVLGNERLGCVEDFVAMPAAHGP